MPSISSNGETIHQKHPPANVANSTFSFTAILSPLFYVLLTVWHKEHHVIKEKASNIDAFSYFTLFFPTSFSISSLVTSKTSNKKMKIGIPIISPHTPKKCSEKINTIKV